MHTRTHHITRTRTCTRTRTHTHTQIHAHTHTHHTRNANYRRPGGSSSSSSSSSRESSWPLCQYHQQCQRCSKRHCSACLSHFDSRAAHGAPAARRGLLCWYVCVCVCVCASMCVCNSLAEICLEVEPLRSTPNPLTILKRCSDSRLPFSL